MISPEVSAGLHVNKESRDLHAPGAVPPNLSAKVIAGIRRNGDCDPTRTDERRYDIIGEVSCMAGIRCGQVERQYRDRRPLNAEVEWCWPGVTRGAGI